MSQSSPVVMVTGAGAGAGRAIARRFGRQGWRVGLMSRDPERLESARHEIERAGGSALVLPTDVADPMAVNSARDKTVAEWGQIDVWVNCAMTTVVGPIEKMDPADFKRVVEVTLLGYVYGTKAALDVMRPCDRGHIIQIGSALAYRAIPLQSAYCSCKFAIRGFTDSLRTELRHQGSAVKVSMLQMPAMNTIQFDWAKNLFRTKYQPVGEVFDPEVAAEAVWRAAHGAPRELWVGGSSIQAIVGQLAFPPLLDRMMAKTGYVQQITDERDPEDRPNNLYAPVRADVAARGRFSDRAKPKALTLDATHARIAAAGALLAGMAAAAGAGFAVGKSR
jgi:NADP-dependent 3-hydroxy acid dehydrogenase YdfG